jgi:Domain of unknown function (DUF4383)
MSGPGAARLWFQIFGLVYAVVAVLEFMIPNGMLLGLISNNPVDTWLHVVLAVAMLAIGFGTPKNKPLRVPCQLLCCREVESPRNGCQFSPWLN